MDWVGGCVTLSARRSAPRSSLDGAVRAALRASSADAQRKLVVGGLAAHGLRYSTYVNVLAQLVPEAYQALRGSVGEVIERWARGWRATDRADDEEARARYFLDVLDLAPGSLGSRPQPSSTCRRATPLRDETRIRRSLEKVLEQAVEAKGATQPVIPLLVLCGPKVKPECRRLSAGR